MVAIGSIEETVAAALLYFYPLAHFGRTYGPVIEKHGVNAFEHQRVVSSAADSPVTRANADTLYSLAAIDLSQNDVSFTIPEITDRGHLFPFHDFYGDNFATLGAYNNQSAGRWLLRLATPGQPAIELTNTTSETCAAYTGFINFPTPYGSLFPRVLLLNTASDSEKTAKIQAGMILENVPRQGPPCSDCPKLTNDLIAKQQLTPASFVSTQNFNKANITNLLTVALRTIWYNLPTSQHDINMDVLRNLTRACTTCALTGTSTCSLSPTLNLTQVSQLCTTWARASVADNSKYGMLPGDNDWRWSKILGHWGSDWLNRAAITQAGYMATDATQYVPPQYVGGNTAILSNESLVLTFRGKPPLQKLGFWSVTVYDADGFLVANPLDRFAIGDRSNLTYSDGSPLFGEKGTPKDDKREFQILIQAKDSPPPANWTGNWLPSPAGGATFGFFLRFYGPTPALTDGSYQFPAVAKMAVFS